MPSTIQKTTNLNDIVFFFYFFHCAKCHFRACYYVPQYTNPHIDFDKCPVCGDKKQLFLSFESLVSVKDIKKKGVKKNA